MRLLQSLVLAAALLAGPALVQQSVAQQPTPAGKPADPKNTLVIELKTGKVLIQLRPDIAPKHVERVKQLAKDKFYDGIVWHRVIAGFMAQSGDPTGTGRGGSKYGNVPAEFTPTPFERGTVGAARSQSPDSANSQFFICFTHTPSLNGGYTVWGKVIEGMQHVDQIAKGEPPATPDKIVRAYILADAPAATAPAGAAPAAAPAQKK